MVTQATLMAGDIRVDEKQIDAVIKQAIAQGAKPRLLHRSIFNLADAYNQAAHLALEKGQKIGNPDYAAPMIMCQSFAIELLLKFFVVVDHPPDKKATDLTAAGIKLRGHTFSQLFDRIGAPRKEAIAKKYASVAKKQTTTPDDFRQALVDLGDDPFVSWRYVYEATGNQHISVVLLSDVSEALGLAAQDATRQLEPPEATG